MLTNAGLPANDGDGCWHGPVLPHHGLHLERHLQVLGVGHACVRGAQSTRATAHGTHG
jgi:hypothetical protein